MSGNPEAVSDLDQFAAGNDHLASRCQFVEHQPHRRGAIVYGDRRGLQQAFEQTGEMRIPLAAASRREIVFQI